MRTRPPAMPIPRSLRSDCFTSPVTSIIGRRDFDIAIGFGLTVAAVLVLQAALFLWLASTTEARCSLSKR